MTQVSQQKTKHQGYEQNSDDDRDEGIIKHG
jgi:hypothetical protein